MKDKRIWRIAELILVLTFMSIASVSAFIIEQPSNTLNIALNQGTLGNIEEGETILYTAANTSSLNDIISLTTTKSNVYLHFDTDLDSQKTNYDTFEIVVKVGDTVPGGSGSSTGDTLATLTIGQPDTASGVALDTAGNWTFDFEITTTAKLVNGNQATTVNITVSLESTS
jgi:hypothetical protein